MHVWLRIEAGNGSRKAMVGARSRAPGVSVTDLGACSTARLTPFPRPTRNPCSPFGSLTRGVRTRDRFAREGGGARPLMGTPQATEEQKTWRENGAGTRRERDAQRRNSQVLSGDGSGVAGRSEVGEVAMEDSGAAMTAVAAMLIRSKKKEARSWTENRLDLTRSRCRKTTSTERKHRDKARRREE